MTEKYPFRDDYISTSEIGRRLGFPLSSGFIANTLGVPPAFRTASGNYWSPEGAHHVYQALMDHIHRAKQELPPYSALGVI